MGLDVRLMVTKPVSVYDNNITHNLGKMCTEVKLYNGMTLYDVLWCPDEQEGLKFARDISDLLSEGLDTLMNNPKHYKQFNPSNGWGNFDNLCKFIYEYRNACWDEPDAELRVSR